MTETVDLNANVKGEDRHPGLEALFDVPLMTALHERRTRRVSRGTSILSDGISHTSQNQPHPLSRLEEAILIMTQGPTGVVMHDGPLQKPEGGLELGTPFMKAVSRTAPSPDNAQATHMFMLNDEGTWLLKALKPHEALKLIEERPKKWQDWTEDDWITAAESMKVKVYDKRIDFPREWPFYIGWNKQISNRPGTTIFFPVVDLTWQYINAFLIVASEPDGQRPLIIDDYQKFHPKDFLDWAAWLAWRLHLPGGTPIPYQPVGGIKRARGGFVNPNNTVPLGYARTWRTDHDAFFLLQNMALVGEAMGLGSWIHASIFPPYVMQRDESKGWYGLGFRQDPPKTFRRWPPLPASQPNFVGIDGILEGLCPPYVKSMDEAVDRVLEDKYGSSGVYGDQSVFERPYKEDWQASEYLSHGTHYSAEAIAYTREICNYIYDTYGRFPAHTNSWYVPGIWVQVSHLENEYYEKFMEPDRWERQAAHDATWGE